MDGLSKRMRTGVLAFSAAIWSVAAVAVSIDVVRAQPAKPEKSAVTIGLAINEPAFLPIYLAEEAGYFKDEGLTVKTLTFRGGSDLTRGLVAGSADIALASPTSVLSAINAGQNVKVFYGGFNHAAFYWYALPPIASLEDAKGKRFGITRFGSLTDALTRFVLTGAKLDPKQDVKIVQGGGPAEQLVALDTKQLDVGIFTWPQNFEAEDRGYKLVARQSDFTPDFPFQSFFAMQEYLDKNPATTKAVLRAFVRGVKLARQDKELSMKLLTTRAGLSEKYAQRAYEQLLGGWREDGRLASDEGIRKFFDIVIATGDVDSHWPKEKYWDNRFVASYDEWRPR